MLGRQGTLEYETAWRVSGDGVKGSKVATKPIAAKEGAGSNMDVVHVSNWLSCIHKGDRKTNCTAEHGYQHAVACIMADQALHSGRRLLFDPKSRKIVPG